MQKTDINTKNNTKSNINEIKKVYDNSYCTHRQCCRDASAVAPLYCPPLNLSCVTLSDVVDNSLIFIHLSIFNNIFSFIPLLRCR